MKSLGDRGRYEVSHGGVRNPAGGMPMRGCVSAGSSFTLVPIEASGTRLHPPQAHRSFEQSFNGVILVFGERDLSQDKGCGCGVKEEGEDDHTDMQGSKTAPPS